MRVRRYVSAFLCMRPGDNNDTSNGQGWFIDDALEVVTVPVDCILAAV